MGEAPDDSLPSLPGWLANEKVSLDRYLMTEYKVGPEPEVMYLLEQLAGLVMRDQREVDQGALRAQRLAVHGAAKNVVAVAAKAREHLQALRIARDAFEAAVGAEFWSAVMLEEAFDIPFVAIDAIEPPEEFDPLRLAFREPHWESVLRDLGKLGVVDKA